MTHRLPGNDYQLHRLPNGLRVITSEMPNALSVSCALFLAVGSRYEDDALAGVSHVVEHMVFKGTRDYPTPKDLALAIEGVGGYFNASTDQEATVFYAK
ncbi:MAG: insulinase family protein, partial [Chloroflexi bacterium]|nr:insulinase family protein [Chloroflexota bacterium]